MDVTVCPVCVLLRRQRSRRYDEVPFFLHPLSPSTWFDTLRTNMKFNTLQLDDVKMIGDKVAND